MKPKEILDYLLPIFEEDPKMLIVELENFPNLHLGQIKGYYNRGGYKYLIKAIAEIKGEDLHI